MSNTMTATRSPSTSTPKPGKGKRGSKIVILHISSERLAQFVEKPAEQEIASSPEATTPPAAMNDIPTLKVEASADAASESNSTPAPASDATPNGDLPKKRKGPAPGTKRNINTLSVDGQQKPRGKPGPKKKPRLEDGTIDHSIKPPNITAAGHKLGPKANQGAINAQLRALDRSGPPCRKWVKKPFQLKSFTGVTFELPSWKGGPKMATLNRDSSSDMKETSQQSSSDVKPNESDAAMESNAGDPMAISTPLASSPPPIPAQPATVSAQA